MNYKPKRKIRFFCPGQVMILMVMTLAFTQAVNAQILPDSIKSKAISEALTEIVNDGKAPGMIAAIISSEGVIAINSAGERKAGSGIAFTTNDAVHLGSCTKAMTATMIATLVAEGKLSWDTKLLDVIPELKGIIHSDYYKITLWQLLTHRAGLIKNAEDWGAHEEKEIKERRLALIKDNLQEPAEVKYGEFHYSNLGYMVAACMAEKITGLSWETLMKKRLFEPLGMTAAGYGAPGTPKQIDQPWGHEKTWYTNKWQSDQTDNPEALGPAGMVHCNINDWAKFLSLQLANENPILERKYLNKLIEPVGYYAGGWGIAEQPWSNGVMLSHNGSNAVWYATVAVAPKLDRAFVVATNSCSFDSTPGICNEILKKLIRIEINK